MTDKTAVLTAYENCPCSGHECGRCYKNARQLLAWDILPVEEPYPVELEPAPTPKKKKNKKEATN